MRLAVFLSLILATAYAASCPCADPDHPKVVNADERAPLFTTQAIWSVLETHTDAEVLHHGQEIAVKTRDGHIFSLGNYEGFRCVASSHDGMIAAHDIGLGGLLACRAQINKAIDAATVELHYVDHFNFSPDASE